jgi:hypothetical protein
MDALPGSPISLSDESEVWQSVESDSMNGHLKSPSSPPSLLLNEEVATPTPSKCLFQVDIGLKDEFNDIVERFEKEPIITALRDRIEIFEKAILSKDKRILEDGLGTVRKMYALIELLRIQIADENQLASELKTESDAVLTAKTAEVQHSQDTIADLQKAVDESRNREFGMEEVLRAKAAEIQALRATIAKHEEEERSNRGNLDAQLRDLKSTYEQKISQRDTTIAHLRIEREEDQSITAARIDSYEEDIARLQSEIDRNNDRHRIERSTMETTISRCQEEIDQRDAQIAQLRRQLELQRPASNQSSYNSRSLITLNEPIYTTSREPTRTSSRTSIATHTVSREPTRVTSTSTSRVPDSAPRCKDGSLDMRYKCNWGKSKYG